MMPAASSTWETLIMDKTIVAELAPTGVLRTGINMSDFLLVTSKAPNGGFSIRAG